MIEKHILINLNLLFKTSSYSLSVQVLHQQIRVGVQDLADTGGLGVQDSEKLSDVILARSLTEWSTNVCVRILGSKTLKCLNTKPWRSSVMLKISSQTY